MGCSQSTHFSPKSKAIGLPFLPKMGCSQSTHFSPKSKAIGLPFLQKWAVFKVLIFHRKVRLTPAGHKELVKKKTQWVGDRWGRII